MSYTSREPWINGRQTYVAAASWAIGVGGLVAGAAAWLGVNIGDVMTAGLLAGFGAAGLVIWSSTRGSGSR
jgi:hypothetical protein